MKLRSKTLLATFGLLIISVSSAAPLARALTVYANPSASGSAFCGGGSTENLGFVSVLPGNAVTVFTFASAGSQFGGGAVNFAIFSDPSYSNLVQTGSLGGFNFGYPSGGVANYAVFVNGFLPSGYWKIFIGAFCAPAVSTASYNGLTIDQELPPPGTTSLGQFAADGKTPIAPGGVTTGTTIVFGASIQASTSTDPLQFQVEVQPSTNGFSGSPTAVASSSEGQSVTVALSGLQDGSYHWAARVYDPVTHAATPWQPFSSSTTDFVVANALVPTSSTVLTDTTTIYSAGNGFVGGCCPNFIMSPGPVFYQSPAPFAIQSIVVDDTDFSSNNHDLVGNIRASIYDLHGNLIARSTNTIYGESGCTGCGFSFSGETVPKDFQLSLVVEDGIQGDGGFTVRNLRFMEHVIQEPLVLMPGILGSKLSKGNQEVWPNAAQMASLSGVFSGDSYLDDLQLDSSGHQIAPLSVSGILGAVSISVVDFPIQRIFYQNVIDEFENNGYIENQSLFIVPYDWRLDLDTQLSLLDSAVKTATAASQTGKINVVAHSLGGLLIKKYFSSIGDSSVIDKLILVGVPEIGAPESFQVLNYGDDFDIPLLNVGEIKKISQNMPAVYELLPSRKYVQVAGDYVTDFRNGTNRTLDYDETATFMQSDLNDSRNHALLAAADQFHQGLDSQALNVGNIYNIVGCLNPTIGAFQIYDNGVVDVTRVSGDGTVPEVSATSLAGNFHSYFVLNNEIGTDHIGLIKDSSPLALIKNIIAGTVSTTLLPPGVSTLLEDCLSARTNAESTIEFSTHSPVSLHVYDEQNRHSGPIANGTIELGIPGSQYQEVGENSFVLVPAGPAYRVLAKGLSSGTFEMKVKGYTGGTVDQEAIYLSVPLQSASTTAELDFSGFQENMGLKLDNNGDGIIDSVIQPNALLSSASAIADVTPPTITMPTIGSTVILGSPVALNFSATDDLSGVASLTGAFDGKAIASTTIVANLSPGAHTLIVTAIDNAGNPRVATLTFSVIYKFSGFLPPTNADGSGAYKQGRTLPVKFTLTDATGTFVPSASPSLSFTLLSSSTSNSSSAAAVTASGFRVSDNQYILNFDTGLLSRGIWQMRLALNDGTTYSVNVVIR